MIGSLDPRQIDRRAVGQGGFAPGELVADEQIFDDPADLVLVHEIVARPPSFEFEVAPGLAVDLREQVEVLAKPGLARIELLEIQHQIGAVELAAAEVGHQQRGNRPAG